MIDHVDPLIVNPFAVVYVISLIVTERESTPPLYPPQVPVIIGVVSVVTCVSIVGVEGAPREAAVVKFSVVASLIPA